MGYDDLVAQVDAGEISMYEATISAGIRKKNPRNTIDGFNRSWQRLSRDDKMRFVILNFKEIIQHVNVVQELKKAKKQ